MSVELERAQRLEQYLAQDPSNSMMLRDIASAYLSAGVLDKSQHYLEKLGEQDGDDPLLLNDLGSLYLAAGQLDEACEVLTIALDLDPEAAPLTFNLGYAEFARGNTELAKKYFQQALAKDPDNTEYLYYHTLACDELGEVEASNNALNALLKLEPDHLRGNLLYALNELQAGELNQARARADRALKRNPTSIEAINLKAEITLLDFEAKKALSYLRQAESIEPGNCQTQLLIGQSLLTLQRNKQAREAFERSLHCTETAFYSYIGLGWSALFQESVIEAKNAFRSALDLEPEEADAHCGLAMALFAENESIPAERHLSKALWIDQQHVTSLLLKSALAEKRGDKVALRSILEMLSGNNQFSPFGWNIREISNRFKDSDFGRRVLEKHRRHIQIKSKERKAHR